MVAARWQGACPRFSSSPASDAPPTPNTKGDDLIAPGRTIRWSMLIESSYTEQYGVKICGRWGDTIEWMNMELGGGHAAIYMAI